MMQLSWIYLPFQALSLAQLYDILAIRQEVFVVEQHCAFLDADGKDQASSHLLGYAPDNALAAYCRIVPPDVIYEGNASIGRVLTALVHRRTQLGRELMHRAIALTKEEFPLHPIRIGAQYYLLNFYGSFGFEATGEPYWEDGILHTKMDLLHQGNEKYLPVNKE